jgi:hypothetical protein
MSDGKGYVKDVISTLLAPRQLGFGVSGGAEAAVRAARCYLENMDSGKLFCKSRIPERFQHIA